MTEPSKDADTPTWPPPSRPLWRRLASRSRDAFYLVATAFDRVTRGADAALLPPWHLRVFYYGTPSPSVYARACAGARAELISRGLRPEHRVLDIGCGIGNLALGLADYLQGTYDGFDIHREAVDWCDRTITARYPTFRFHHADLSSRAYNAEGTLAASAFSFPLPSASFDVVFLGSVFTHLLPDAVEQYVREIGRLLAPGGICVASYFLLNDQTRPGVDAGHSFMPFKVDHPSGSCRLHDAAKPESAVALEEAFVVAAHEQAGLQIRHVRRGNWWRGADHDQDVLTAERPVRGA
jgi:SAM-dependent methyltransferase